MADPSAASTWPALTFETLPWAARQPGWSASRTQLRRHTGPYNASIPARICAVRLHLPESLAAMVDDATNEVARFDTEVGAEIAPFSAVLLRSESAASSNIENLTAGARAIAEAELDPRAGGNAAKIVANSKAMTAALRLADRLDAEAILAMHDELLRPSAPHIAGAWRTEQVWIGGGSLGPHQALFVPPHHSRVAAAVDDLVAFLARDDLPALAHAAIGHAQFETIHPFPDGNGRTGRALVHALLRAKGLTRAVTVPVSAGLLVDVEAYFAALTAYRQGDPEPTITRFVEAAFAATTNGRHLVADLRDLRQSWAVRITARRDSGAWKLADSLLRQPVVNRDVAARELGVTATNVYGPIKALVDAGVLVETTNRSRGQVWRAPEVLTALDAFAARAGRRPQPPTG